jgi:hypothetical protein
MAESRCPARSCLLYAKPLLSLRCHNFPLKRDLLCKKLSAVGLSCNLSVHLPYYTASDPILTSTRTSDVTFRIAIDPGQGLQHAVRAPLRPAATFVNYVYSTYLLTPHSTVLLETLTGLQPVKKFPAFYGTRRFITALKNARHLSIS